MLKRKRIGMGIGVLLGLSLMGVAHADGLVIATDQLKVSAAKPLADLVVQNTSSKETTVHFDVTSWKQEGEREHLTPDRRLIVHPQTMKLKPGETGKAQVGLKLSGPRWDEEAFRIMISETPPVPDVGAASVRTHGSRTIKRGSVPVFLLPPGAANPRVTWSVERNLEGAVVLRASNNGRGHLQLNSASLLGPEGQSVSKANMTDILLPGGSRSWTLSADAAAGVWLLTAETNAGRMNAQLEMVPGLSTASISPASGLMLSN